MQNIAIIKQGTGRYLFSVPENVTLHEGDRVKCSTNRGMTDGIAFADSAWVDENVSQLIGKLTGAKFPLKSVVGRLEYLPFEKPESNPAANPANKYDGMSNKQLDREMCGRAPSCHARNDGSRKHDCLFADDFGSCDVNDANRADVIKYLLAEDAEAAPKPQDKPEPIKLYCAKDYIDAKLIKGAVCTFNPDAGAVELPDGSLIGCSASPRSYDDWKTENPCRAECLVPLVKRPAKVGEWVYPTTTNPGLYSQGKIARVTQDDNALDHTVRIEGSHVLHGGCWIREYNYLVLDGYHPEPETEPEPEYWNGKVVCVEEDGFFTVGKVYEIRDGIIRSNTGNAYNAEEPIKSLDDLNDGTWEPKFIEYKGEAND